MTRRVKAIEKHARDPYVEINGEDASRLKINDNDLVKVSSRRGSIVLKARITERVNKGEVFIPMHYPEAAVNILTNDNALDKYAKTPEYKVTAVKIELVEDVK